MAAWGGEIEDAMKRIFVVAAGFAALAQTHARAQTQGSAGCAGAVVLARLSRLVFGAWDPKAGAVGSLWDVVRDRRLNHRPEVVGGVRADECGALLADFFAARRHSGPGVGLR